MLRANFLWSLLLLANQTLMHRIQLIRYPFEISDLRIFEPSLYDIYGNERNEVPPPRQKCLTATAPQFRPRSSSRGHQDPSSEAPGSLLDSAAQGLSPAKHDPVSRRANRKW